MSEIKPEVKSDNGDDGPAEIQSQRSDGLKAEKVEKRSPNRSDIASESQGSEAKPNQVIPSINDSPPQTRPSSLRPLELYSETGSTKVIDEQEESQKNMSLRASVVFGGINLGIGLLCVLISQGEIRADRTSSDDQIRQNTVYVIVMGAIGALTGGLAVVNN